MASAIDFIAEQSENDILNKMLGATSDNYDKRQGSVIFEAIISMAIALYEFYHNHLQAVYAGMSILTATGTDLDGWGETFGIERLPPQPTYWEIIRYNEDDASNVGDMEEGELLDAHDDNSQWEYTGGDVVKSLLDGDYSPFGVLEPVREWDNITMVEFGITCVQHGRFEESDAEYRQRIVRSLRSYGGGSILQYADLIVNRYPQTHPDATPFSGVLVFPLGRHCGYVNVYPMYDGRKIPTTLELLALKNWLDPLNAEGWGAGLAPIGHRIRCQQAKKKMYGWRVWINDGTQQAYNSTDADGDKVKKCIDDYFTQEFNASVWSNSGVPDAKGNTINMRLRTSNIIAAISGLRASDSSIRSIQLDRYNYRTKQWVITSDDTMDYKLKPKNVRVPYVDTAHFVVMRGNRDWM